MEKIEILKKEIKGNPDILLGFLFGSRAKDLHREEADWDIALHLRNYTLEKEKKIWERLEFLLKEKIDLIILNQDIDPLLFNRILNEAIVLDIKDRFLYLDLLLKFQREAEDFKVFCNEYYQIFLRSKSLSEEDKIRIKRIVTFLSRELEDFERFKKIDYQLYQKNISLKRELERWTENIINAILDISKIIISSFKFPMPKTYRETVFALNELNIFSSQDLEKISSWVNLRNILAHEYLRINWERIRDFLDNSYPFLIRFLEEVKKIIEK
jgi:uncharacterized protein YutE (UPF0331/DUF86 family)/predicted nucleotidyltransferase